MEQNSKHSIVSLQGIVRSKNVVNQQDGECEDIVNLKFKDGSFRTSGKGRVLLTTEQQEAIVADYSQMFVHKVDYAHLLGVKNGKLYYFANILTGDIIEFLEQEQEICEVVGDLYIQQTGHIISIIDDKQNLFIYSIFKPKEKSYSDISIDNNLTQKIIFNLKKAEENVYFAYKNGVGQINEKSSFLINGEDGGGSISNHYNKTIHNNVISVFSEVTKKNQFTRPFLICACIRLYDKSFINFSPVQLLFPYAQQNKENWFKYAETGCEKMTDVNYAFCTGISFSACTHEHISSNGQYLDGGEKIFFDPKTQNYCIWNESGKVKTNLNSDKGGIKMVEQDVIPALTVSRFDFYGKNSNMRLHLHSSKQEKSLFDILPIEVNGYIHFNDGYSAGFWEITSSIELNYWTYILRGSNIQFNVTQDLIDFLNKNADIIEGVSLFVSPQIDLYYMQNAEQLEIEGMANKIGQVFQISAERNYSTIWSNGTLEGVRDKDKELGCIQPQAFAMEWRTNEEIIHDIQNTQLYHLVDLTAEDLKTMQQNGGVVDLSKTDTIHKDLLYKIQQGKGFPLANFQHTFNSYTRVPKVHFLYNGQMHIANYTEELNLPSLTSLFNGGRFLGLQNEANAQGERLKINTVNDTIVVFQTLNGDYVQIISSTTDLYALNRYISTTIPLVKNITIYLPASARKIIGKPTVIYYRKITYTLKKHTHINAYFHIRDDFNFHDLLNEECERGEMTVSEWENFIQEKLKSFIENKTNYLMVSDTNNPLLFTEENTYKIGNGEILAICTNSVAVNTGQVGNVPLLVFTTEGIYALQTTLTGEIAYSKSNILSRDICNNPKSVTAIDGNIVFTTDRGIMVISNTHAISEIGEDAEGDVLDFTQETQQSYKIMHNAFTKPKLANLDENLQPSIDFLNFAKNAIINYNHNEKELWLSIPQLNEDGTFQYPYTYVLSNGIWTRRDFSALEYVNNFPTSYRKDADGKLYKVDEQEGTGDNTQINMGASEADNKFFVLTRAIKLQTLGLKQAYRIVARGDFQTLNDSKLGLYIFGSNDGIKWGWIGGNEKQGKMSNIGCVIERVDVRYFRILLCGQITGQSRFNYFEIANTTANNYNGKIR